MRDFKATEISAELDKSTAAIIAEGQGIGQIEIVSSAKAVALAEKYNMAWPWRCLLCGMS